MDNTRRWFISNKKLFKGKLEKSCVNCGGVASMLHHIVPLANGGTNNESNIVQVCDRCHGLVHGINQINHSELTKNGIKASPNKSGRKHNQLDKMTEELEADIKAFLNDRSIKQVDLMDKHGISRNTLKKYVEVVKGE